MLISQDEDIKYMLGRLEGKVDSLIAGMKQQTQEIQEHEKRIRILENSKAWVLGSASAAAVIISITIQYLFKGP